MPSTNDKVDVFTLYDMSGGPDDCWPWRGAWGGRDRALRPYFQFGGKRMLSYRAVYELVHGVTLTSDQLLRHSCDHGDHPVGCGNPKHLSIGTNSQNMQDMKERQRHGLPHSVVRAIRKLLANGRTQEEVAELYGISPSTVSAINNKVVYDHVTDE